jgi:hypothetical protein
MILLLLFKCDHLHIVAFVAKGLVPHEVARVHRLASFTNKQQQLVGVSAVLTLVVKVHLWHKNAAVGRSVSKVHVFFSLLLGHCFHHLVQRTRRLQSCKALKTIDK